MPCNSVITMRSSMAQWNKDVADKMLARLYTDRMLNGRTVEFVNGELMVRGAYLSPQEFSRIKALCIQQYGVQVVKMSMAKMGIKAEQTTRLTDGRIHYVVGRA